MGIVYVTVRHCLMLRFVIIGKLPPFRFEANDAMVADGGPTCKGQLERAVMGGWHKGQVFYYRY